MNRRILCVDDEPSVLRGLRRNLHGSFEVHIAEGAKPALRILEDEDPFGVVLTDMRMPDMNGIEFLGIVREKHPETVRMMLTGQTDQDTASSAVNRGQIFRFLNKPCPKDELVDALESGLAQYRLVHAERELLEETLRGSIRVLTEILALADPAMAGRVSGMRELVGPLARSLDIEDTWQLDVAIMLSQLGRITVPAEVRAKEEEGQDLEPSELTMLQRVPEVGYDLLRHVPRLEEVSEIVRFQARDFAAPDGPSGADLPVGARILRILNDLIAEVDGDRSAAEALEVLEGRAHAYDPEILVSLRRLTSKSTKLARTTRAIAFGDLCAGHVLAAPLKTRDGRRLLREGHVISHALMAKLENYSRTTGLVEPIEVFHEEAAA